MSQDKEDSLPFANCALFARSYSRLNSFNRVGDPIISISIGHRLPPRQDTWTPRKLVRTLMDNLWSRGMKINNIPLAASQEGGFRPASQSMITSAIQYRPSLEPALMGFPNKHGEIRSRHNSASDDIRTILRMTHCAFRVSHVQVSKLPSITATMQPEPFTLSAHRDALVRSCRRAQ